MQKHLILLLILILTTTSITSQINRILGESRQGSLLIGSGYNLDSIKIEEQKLQLDENGIFLLGFDRDDEGLYELLVYYDGNKTDTIKLEVQKRDFPVERINNKKQQFSSPPKSELKRIQEERKILSNAREKIGAIDSSLYIVGFKKPLNGGRVTGVFGSQRILNDVPRSTHNGMDIAAKRGTPVYAMTDGIVKLAGENFYYSGNFVLIEHGQSLSSIYLHLSKLSVKTGERIKKGEKIGEIGTSGRSTGPHLHWGIQWKNKRIDPQSILDLNF